MFSMCLARIQIQNLIQKHISSIGNAQSRNITQQDSENEINHFKNYANNLWN